MVLSIILVNWNVAELLTACLSSIEANLRDFSHEVLVIDNASTDHSLEILARNHRGVRLISNRENWGFAKANNQGFALARGTYILILNPDTIIKPGAIRTLLDVLETRPEVGIVGPRVVEGDQTVVRACRRKHISIGQILKGLFLTDKFAYWLLKSLFGRRFVAFADRHYYRSGRVDCLQGSCMMMRKADLDKVGWFDERVPMYLDDSDLCLRMQQYGLQVYYCAETEIVHHGASSVRKLGNMRMSSLVGSLANDAYFLKHHSVWHVGVHHAMLLTSSVIFLGVDLILLPVLLFFKPRFITQYAVKHFWTLIYSLTFRFRSDSLPAGWPRSLWPGYRHPKP